MKTCAGFALISNVKGPIPIFNTPLGAAMSPSLGGGGGGGNKMPRFVSISDGGHLQLWEYCYQGVNADAVSVICPLSG